MCVCVCVCVCVFVFVCITVYVRSGSGTVCWLLNMFLCCVEMEFSNPWKWVHCTILKCWPASTLWCSTTSQKNKGLCCVYKFLCLLFRNNWLTIHLTGRVETISNLCSSQWATVDEMSSGHVLSLFVLEPGVAPELNATMPVSDCTNSSFTVHWQPPHNCTLLNGYMYQYRFQLVDHNSSAPLREGITHLTSATFSGLTPHTMYTVRVYLVTSGGWNSKHPLKISAQTKPTS